MPDLLEIHEFGYEYLELNEKSKKIADELTEGKVSNHYYYNQYGMVICTKIEAKVLKKGITLKEWINFKTGVKIF